MPLKNLTGREALRLVRLMDAGDSNVPSSLGWYVQLFDPAGRPLSPSTRLGDGHTVLATTDAGLLASFRMTAEDGRVVSEGSLLEGGRGCDLKPGWQVNFRYNLTLGAE